MSANARTLLRPSVLRPLLRHPAHRSRSITTATLWKTPEPALKSDMARGAAALWLGAVASSGVVLSFANLHLIRARWQNFRASERGQGFMRTAGRMIRMIR